MQQLIDEISQVFTKYLNAKVDSIPESEQVRLFNNITDYLMGVGSNHSDIATLKNEFIVNKFCGGYTNILHIAAKFCDINQLQGLIEVVGVEFINILDADMRTPLHHSAIGGVAENSIFLMNEGADLNAKSSDATRNWLPIHYAVRSGTIDMVNAMIDRGANPRDKTSFGLNCLHVACEFGHVDIAERMINLGLDIDAPTNYSNLSMCSIHYAAAGNFVKVADLLFCRGADRNKTNDDGLTALDLAVSTEYLDLAEFFLERGVVSYDSAHRLAVIRGNFTMTDLIKKYLKARDELFNIKYLKSFAPFLEEVILSYKVETIEEPRITLFGGARINSFGIIAISKKMGIFKKSPINLAAFAKSKKLKSLAESLEKVRHVIFARSIQ